MEAQNKKAAVFLRNGKVLVTAEPLHLLEEIFTQSDGFFKCHRSYLVCLPNIDSFGKTEIITKSGRKVPIARGCAAQLRDAYFQAMFKDD